MKTHRPLLWIFICFALGIGLNEYFWLPFIPVVVSAAVMLALNIFLRHWKILSRIFFLSVIFLSGLLYARQNSIIPWDHIMRVMPSASEPLTLEGTVVSDVQKRAKGGRIKTVFAFQLKKWKTPTGWRPVSGKVLGNVFRDLTDEENTEKVLQYGDDIILEGKLHPPFDFSPEDRFSYREYLRRQGIPLILSVKKKAPVQFVAAEKGSLIVGAALKTRKHLKKILTSHLSSIEAGIMNALILGERYDIPEDIKNLFVLTGTAHILAISGFNVGIVASLLFLFLKVLRFPRSWQYILTMLLLAFYAFMTGGQPPVVRATIMAVVFLMGFLLEREMDSVNTLSFAALLILFINPSSLFDVGFQLSFVSVLFIILFYTTFLKGIDRWGGKVPLFLRQSLAVSLVAWLGVFGLISYYFNIITPVTILANLFIIPIVSFLTALGLGLMLAGLLWPPAALCLIPLIKIFLNALVYVAYFFSLLPGAFFFIPNVSLWQVWVYYLLIILILELGRRIDKANEL